MRIRLKENESIHTNIQENVCMYTQENIWKFSWHVSITFKCTLFFNIPGQFSEKIKRIFKILSIRLKVFLKRYLPLNFREFSLLSWAPPRTQ